MRAIIILGSGQAAVGSYASSSSTDRGSLRRSMRARYGEPVGRAGQLGRPGFGKPFSRSALHAPRPPRCPARRARGGVAMSLASAQAPPLDRGCALSPAVRRTQTRAEALSRPVAQPGSAWPDRTRLARLPGEVEPTPRPRSRLLVWAACPERVAEVRVAVSRRLDSWQPVITKDDTMTAWMQASLVSLCQEVTASCGPTIGIRAS